MKTHITPITTLLLILPLCCHFNTGDLNRFLGTLNPSGIPRVLFEGASILDALNGQIRGAIFLRFCKNGDFGRFS